MPQKSIQLVDKEDSGPMTAHIENTADGHGAQFKIHLKNAIDKFPPDVLSAIMSEATYGAAIYVDGFVVDKRSGDITISLCRGSLVMAKVDYRWNSNRKDKKFRVILREDRDEGD